MNTKTETYPQRSEYMDGKISHQKFYASVAKTAGIKLDNELVERCRNAYAQGDDYLNKIPLAVWDGMVGYHGAIKDALKLHGDFYSMAGSVCTLKAAAREQMREQAKRYCIGDIIVCRGVPTDSNPYRGDSIQGNERKAALVAFKHDVDTKGLTFWYAPASGGARRLVDAGDGINWDTSSII